MNKTPFYTAHIDDDGDVLPETLAGFSLRYDARRNAEREAKDTGGRVVILEAKEAVWAADAPIVDDTDKPAEIAT